MSENPSFVTIGRITRPHGIRGDVCAQYYAESFSYLDNGQALIKTERSAPKPLSISSWRMQGEILVLKFKGVDTRTDAEFLRNYDIVINEDLLTYDTLSENDDSENADYDGENTYDEPFLHHILGAKAIVQKANQNNPAETIEEELGIIEEITFPGGQELWTIKNDKGQEILFPAVSLFIDRYDLAHNKIYINPPEGLIELYLEEEETPTQEPREMKVRQNAHKDKPLCGEGKKILISADKKEIRPKTPRAVQAKSLNQAPLKDQKVVPSSDSEVILTKAQKAAIAKELKDAQFKEQRKAKKQKKAKYGNQTRTRPRSNNTEQQGKQK